MKYNIRTKRKMVKHLNDWFQSILKNDIQAITKDRNAIICFALKGEKDDFKVRLLDSVNWLNKVEANPAPFNLIPSDAYVLDRDGIARFYLVCDGRNLDKSLYTNLFNSLGGLAY